jgi:hypothetical protein
VQRRMNVSRPGCSVSTYYRNNVSVTLFLPLFCIILIIMFGKLVATETLKWASWISTMSIVKDSFPITVPLFYHRNGRWILLHSMYFTSRLLVQVRLYYCINSSTSHHSIKHANSIISLSMFKFKKKTSKYQNIIYI